MYLILAQIHSRIFNILHWIPRKINTLKKKNKFWNEYEIVQYEIPED